MNSDIKCLTIADRHAAEALAEQILDPRRLFPLVIVTTPAGRTEPHVPVIDLIDAVSHRADVMAVTQQASNWLSTRLEELGHSDLTVYGGATRLYPTGTSDPELAPIFSVSDYLLDQAHTELPAQVLLVATSISDLAIIWLT